MWKGRLVLLLCLSLLTGCGHWGPAIISTGASGIHFWRNGRVQEALDVSMERAYDEAIRTTMALGVEIDDIKIGTHKRSIEAKGRAPGSCRVTIDLEDMGDGNYVKATVKALRHRVFPDHVYSQMFMKEFKKGIDG